MLIEQVRNLINRLAPRGWQTLLQAHGLHLSAIDLAAELRRPLIGANGKSTIDRTLAGFEDFSSAGVAAIEPGDPARSLLFHALASPNVYPPVTGTRTDADFPTLIELDALENYIYGLAQRKLQDLGNVVVAVFAYQYRPGSASVHGSHADMAFSRIGVARVGTAPPHYDALRRSFWAVPPNGASGTSVMPARYAAFLAEKRKLTSKDAVVHPLNGDDLGDSGRTFLVPVHKLFAGTECLSGENISLSFLESHRNEKLSRLHQLPASQGGVPVIPGFNITQPPFVRESQDLVNLQPVGASTLLLSIPQAALVETATQMNSVSGKAEFVRFRVPPANNGNRFPAFSSFQTTATGAGRAAPEYANIRLHVRPNGQLFDVNTLDTANYTKVLQTGQFKNVPGVEDGPLEAAHLLDHSCEGAIAANVTLSKVLPAFSAISFVAAPDLLPLVGQIDVQRWAERNKLTGDVYFEQGAPEPLCYGRDVTPNPTLRDPGHPTNPAFDRADAANKTIGALISAAPRGQAAISPVKTSVATTWLTDAAANVFEPGWDTSMFSDTQGDFYVNYGLGSPFPEDAKLCAALNSFWPAAAPDAGRTFGLLTALPLLDAELGLHPKHPNVLAGMASSQPGWDGEFGPFFANNGGAVNFSAIERSDYSAAALTGRITPGSLGQIETAEQLARMDAFRECADRLRGKTLMKNFFTLLVTAEKVADWSLRPDRFAATLTGPGYLYVFADSKNAAEDPTDPKRTVATVTNVFTCQVTAAMVGLKKNNGPAKVTPWLHP